MGAVRRLLLVLISVLCLTMGLLVPAGAQGGNASPAGKLKAQSTALVTTYTAALTDPDNNPMFYKWGASVACGTFTPGDVETATWDRAGGTPCAPGADAQGLVWVHVTDGLAFVGCFYRGSATGDGPDCVTATDGSRRISLILRSKAGKLKVSGALRLEGSNPPAALETCLANQSIDIEKMKKGAWVIKKTIKSDAKGSYSTSMADKPGTYRIYAPQLSVAEPAGETVNFYNCVTSVSTGVPNR